VPSDRTAAGFVAALVLALSFAPISSCSRRQNPEVPTVRWYTFHERSGAFAEAARGCSERSGGAYEIEVAALPADADQQREQVVRRLAARDPDIDVIGMDVIWTAEFARAGWILPWDEAAARTVSEGRLAPTVQSGRYGTRLFAAPFTTNTQLLWYRTDRVDAPPRTWDEMISMAERLGPKGAIEAQGQRYEGLTVFFVSLLASAGGSVLDPTAERVSLEPEPTRLALEVMRRFARSPAADPSLPTLREDEARLAFESGRAAFMTNYTFVWPAAQRNAPDIARRMGFARWPAVVDGHPSRVALGGLNLGIGAYSRHADLAFRAAACLASEPNQLRAAVLGGLLPSSERLYANEELRKAFPFADLLRETLRDAVLRPETPVYNDVSLAIARTLHPMSAIDPARDAKRLRETIDEALHSRGLL
jgi:multiple sugar transport system substrate-binding protein